MSARYLEVAARSKTLRDEATTLFTKESPSAEDHEKAKKLVDDAEVLMAQASRLKKLELDTDHVLPQGDGSTPDDQKKDTPAPEFKNWREFIGAAKTAIVSKGSKIDPRLRFFDETLLADFGRKDLTGQTGASGGILVPEQRLQEIMSIATPLSIVREGATVIPAAGRTVIVPVLDQTSTAAGENFFGGIAVYWTEEAGDATASEPKWRDAELIVRELVGYTVVGNSLLNDVPALAGFLGGKMGFPGAMARAENRAFLKGSGVGQPMGILNSQAAVIVSRTTTNEIKMEDLAKMEAAFWGENPVWIASYGAKAKLIALKGPDSNPLFLWGNAITGQPATLLGHPIKFSDSMPATGIGDLMLVDRTYYLIADLESGTTLESSSHEKFQKNKTAFRIVKRVDGRPWLSAPITLEDGTTKLSPFVILNT